MDQINSKIYRALKERLKGKVVIIGIGNTLKADDGFGPKLIKNIKNKVKAALIDAGTAPENYIGKINSLKPDTIVILDVVDFKEEPGCLKIFEIEQIQNLSISTHNPSLKLFSNLIFDKKRDIFLLSCQPKNLNLGDKISPEVQRGISILKSYFIIHLN